MAKPGRKDKKAADGGTSAQPPSSGRPQKSTKGGAGGERSGGSHQTSQSSRSKASRPPVGTSVLFSSLCPTGDSLVSLAGIHHNASSIVHPEVLKLGLKIANGVIAGGVARCIGLLVALQAVIADYETPRDAELSRDLGQFIKPQIQFIVSCRPLNASMSNAINWLKHVIGGMDPALSDSEARASLIRSIDDYIKERIESSISAIAAFVASEIKDGDVVATYGYSTSVMRGISEAVDVHKTFSVIVIDAAPHFEGRRTSNLCLQLGLSVRYVLLPTANTVLSEANMLLVGCSALFCNGTLISRAGTSLCCLAAKYTNTPVLVCAETIKFRQGARMDALEKNERHIAVGEEERVGAKEGGNLQSQELALRYDATPMESLTAVVTEFGIIPPTSVVAIVREYSPQVLPS